MVPAPLNLFEPRRLRRLLGESEDERLLSGGFCLMAENLERISNPLALGRLRLVREQHS
jgi:hypothetical protein